MQLLILLILLINIFLSYKVVGFKKNPFLIFNVWWFIWLSLSFLNIVNYYDVSDIIYFWITLSILAINIIPFLFNGYKLKKLGNIKSRYIKYSILCEILYLLIIIYYLFKMLSLMGGFENYWKVRFYFYGLELDGKITNLFDAPLVAHMFFLLKSLSVVNYIIGLALLNDRKGRVLFFLPLLNIALFCLLAAGRDIIFYMVIMLIFSLKSGRFIYYAKYYSLIVFFVLYMTTLRGGLDTAFYAFISYFTGPIIYMDLLIKGADQFYYGNVILSQIFSPFIYILNPILGGENAFTIVGQELMGFVQISEDSHFYDYFNALPTWMYFFYRDFGYAGFIIYPMLISSIVMLIYSKLNVLKSEHLALMSFLEACLLWSIFKPEILGFYNILTILLIILYLKGGGNAARSFSNRL